MFAVFYAMYAIFHKKLVVRNVLLLVFSLLFYYKISGLFVILLVLMGTLDFFLGLLMFKSKSEGNRKLMLLISICVNIGALLYFKYLTFFIETWFGLQGMEPGFTMKIIAPVGLSFFVFKTLSYTIDLYREMIEEPERNYLNYLMYVTFFPNILAGPISRARDLLPQINKPVTISSAMMSKGFFLICLGAFKKIFIADYLASNLVDRVFESARFFTGFENLMAAYAAMMQLYADFSGYTDMVVGIALLLGFIVEPNFNRPFSAVSLTDFWRRWHMTLLKWLTEYVYLPITWSLRKIGKAGIIIGILLTFVISGLWHGANINYVVWGLIHGVVLSIELLTQKARDFLAKYLSKGLFKVLGWLFVFNFLAFSIILFKSDGLNAAWMMYSKILTDFDLSIAVQWLSIYKGPVAVLLLGFLMHFLPEKWKTSSQDLFARLHWSLKAVSISVVFLMIYQVYSTDPQPFIYLQF
jgi:D-alanyl-lipoteichoic acid acyltransferase DltB (MBOAT superfamily)